MKKATLIMTCNSFFIWIYSKNSRNRTVFFQFYYGCFVNLYVYLQIKNWISLPRGGEGTVNLEFIGLIV